MGTKLIAEEVVKMKTGTGSESATVKIPSGKNLNAQRITNNVFSTAFFLIGIVAVISLIISAYKYMMANGDASKAKTAMSAIIYSIIGLVVAVSGYTIVNWVLTGINA